MTPDFQRQKKTALRVYKERSEQLLKYLQNHKIDEFLTGFKEFKAAFHNFRTADALSEQEESLEKNLKELYNSISLIEQDLQNSLEQILEVYRDRAMKIGKDRKNLNKFRSNQEIPRSITQKA